MAWLNLFFIPKFPCPHKKLWLATCLSAAADRIADKQNSNRPSNSVPLPLSLAQTDAVVVVVSPRSSDPARLADCSLPATSADVRRCPSASWRRTPVHEHSARRTWLSAVPPCPAHQVPSTPASKSKSTKSRLWQKVEFDKMNIQFASDSRHGIQTFIAIAVCGLSILHKHS